jgi:osmotically-inducible protein OsmY
MVRRRKWIWTLGALALTPGVVAAGPFSLGKPAASAAASSAAAPARSAGNQQVADHVAAALRAARLEGAEIDIRVEGGTAVLLGTVAHPGQKAAAHQAAASVPGVRNVDNRLTAKAPARTRSAIQQVSAEEIAAPEGLPVAAPGGKSNQDMAQDIATALSAARLSGYDVEIHYQNGTAVLAGTVQSPAEWQKIGQVVSQVPGVGGVDNRIQVRPATAQAPVQRVNYQPMPGAQPPMPQGYGHGGPGAAGAMYNMPHMPDHSWPTYAAYPNYAQVAYPTEYSASAWPYIGPFYPYPQVPLGWRRAQLEWDDGSWYLNFSPRTEKWFWFLDPKVW